MFIHWSISLHENVFFHNEHSAAGYSHPVRVPCLAMVSLGIVRSHPMRVLSSTMTPWTLSILVLEKAISKISSVSNQYYYTYTFHYKGTVNDNFHSKVNQH